MILFLRGHTYKYESEKVCRIFFPTAKITFAEENAPEAADEDRVIAEKKETENGAVYACMAVVGGKTAFAAVKEDPSKAELIEENALAAAMLQALGELTGITPPWGILTGVRPSKLMRKLIAQRGEAQAVRSFQTELQVSPSKTELARRVALAENDAVALSRPDSCSLYVAIPFCPTRCSYCSFVSHSIASAKKLIPDYVRLLGEELRQTAAIVRELGLRLETVYFGGGTPTSLSAADLAALLDTVNASFDMTGLREFTVEAGRPDTVDEEKLRVLKNGNVGRISINPQTFSDAVLENIGRKHTAADIEEKYLLARKTGFDNINMDLIAGLAGDTPEGFAATVDRAITLAPENITVHTLALKRAADLVTGGGETGSADHTPQMVEYANAALSAAGYAPYYMYRQSKSLGNLENVGWTVPGKACLYNIYMMEETHTVLACGAGAVTKLKAPFGELIERIYNFKYPYEYISRFPELTARKAQIAEFYVQNRKEHTDG